MPPPGRRSASRRSTSIASPKCRKRPPLQVPIALRPGSRTAGAGSGVGVGGRLLATGIRLAALIAVAVVALLRADANPLGLGLGLLRTRGLLRFDDRQAERLVVLVAGRVALDHHGRARNHLALAQDFVGERVLDVALDRAAQRTGAHRGVPTLVDQQVLGLVGQIQLQLVLGDLDADAVDHQIDDLLDLVLGELVEDDHLVDPVEELRPEDFFQVAHDPVLHVAVGHAGLVGDGEPDRGVLRDLAGADVRGHDHDRVAEVDGATLGVGEAPVLEDLQEDVEDVRVRLLDLVEQQHAVGLAPHGLGQLAALVVADVARGRADQAADRVLLHVLGHVDPDHRLLVAEEELGEGAGELGLADPGRAEEDERAGRALRVLDPGAGAADRFGDGGDRDLLADHPLVEFFLHADQFLGLGLGQLEDRDAGPHRDDVGDLLLAHLGSLAVLTLGPLVFELALAGGQLALGVAQIGGFFELLGLDRRLLLAPRRLDFLLEVAVDRRRRHRLDAHPRAGLVDQVDRLVGQEAVGDVAVGELGGGGQRFVVDRHPVVLFVALAQPLEDLDRVLGRGLVDLDLGEAALQRRVALEVLAVHGERGRADRLQLAAGQGRLQDRSGVDRALGGAGADQVVELVDEKDDVAALGDLLHHLLEALLEFAAVLGARDQGSQVEGVDLLVLEQLGDLAVGDPRGQPLDDGGLADARLAEQHRVVLGAAGEDLHDPLDLDLAADHGVELALGGEFGQVAAELVEQLRGLLALAAGASTGALAAAAGAGEHPDDLVADLLGVGVEVEQDACGDALVLADQAEQDVLGANVVVAQAQRLAEGELEDLLRAWREGDLAGGDFLAGADDADDLRTDTLDGDVERLEHPCGQALLLAEQAEQDVLSAYVVVLESPRLLLGEDDYLAGSLCESLEHSVSLSLVYQSFRLGLVAVVGLDWH